MTPIILCGKSCRRVSPRPACSRLELDDSRCDFSRPRDSTAVKPRDRQFHLLTLTGLILCQDFPSVLYQPKDSPRFVPSPFHRKIPPNLSNVDHPAPPVRYNTHLSSAVHQDRTTSSLSSLRIRLFISHCAPLSWFRDGRTLKIAMPPVRGIRHHCAICE